jgi:hypothetical protein
VREETKRSLRVGPGPVASATVTPGVSQQHLDPVIARIHLAGPFARGQLLASIEQQHRSDLPDSPDY